MNRLVAGHSRGAWGEFLVCAFDGEFVGSVPVFLGFLTNAFCEAASISASLRSWGRGWSMAFRRGSELDV